MKIRQQLFVIESGQGNFLYKKAITQVAEAIWLDIKLGQDIMPIIIFPIFHEDRMTTI